MAKYKKRPDGRYATRVSTGRYDSSGKQIVKTLYGRTIAELDSKVESMRTDLRRGSYADDLGRTFIEYAEIWLARKEHSTELATYKKYRATVRTLLSPLHPLRLRSIERPDLYCPSDEDVRQLLSCIEDRDLRIAVLLAAFGPLRRSEICALTSDDIDGSWITVNKAVVQNEIGEWVVKGTKTVGSIRRIQMPDFVVKELDGIQGPVITCSPSAISSRFVKALEESGCPKFRFHDLRHYSASIMHAIGVPDQYIMSRGGWSTDNVMKRVYRNVIDLEEAKQTRKITEHFSTLAK